MKFNSNYIARLRDRLRIRLWHIGINYDEAKVPPYALPDPLLLNNGRIVNQLEEWKKNRRQEIMHLFQEHVYGRSPKWLRARHFHQTSLDSHASSGLATRKEISIFPAGKPDGFRFHLLLYVPNNARKPVPAFLGLNFFGNHTIHADAGISITRQWKQLHRNALPSNFLPSDETRGTSASRWPVEEILRRGYALATAHYGEIEPDFPSGWQYGIRGSLFARNKSKPNPLHAEKTTLQQTRQNSEVPARALPEYWGAIGVWAWGLSCIMDYLEQDADICALRIALIGHSRLGKAALWAGAQDERFSIVISNNSGSGGAALSRRRFGETIKLTNQVNPHWFRESFKSFNDRENRLPVDQHMLIALIAPRPVYIASAEHDQKADPYGEFLSAKHADAVYGLYGLTGIGVEQMPALNEPIGQAIGYHIRTGKHDITNYDWNQYLCFADRQFG